MKYTELTVSTTTLGSELVADVMWNYTDVGVAINDVNDIIELSKSKRKMWDYMEDGLTDNKDVLVKGYFNLNDEKTVRLAEKDIFALKENAPFELGSLETAKRTVDGDDWLNIWKEHFRPIHIGGVVVCPEWIEYTPEKNEKVVKIDSNMAFGTGEHETTSMCIKFLQKYVHSGESVIDVGCGSGILGITASLIGSGKVMMTDIDPLSVEAAKRNAALNSIEADISEKNLLDDSTVKGDIIVANIMAEILVDFSADIKNNLNENGKIILSGILNVKREMVEKAYLSVGFKEIDSMTDGEWCALVFEV